MASNADQTKKPQFKDTLNLPRTEFPIRANAKESDAIMLKRWAEEDIYTKTFFCHEGKHKFILHDGPPFANGNIHLGHAFNKIRKDTIAKSQRMLGKQVPVQPGWDCHGLPIEIKVGKEHPNATPVELKKACRAYAMHWINVQRDEFKQLAVFMDWKRPYLTMNPSYEASIMQAFGVFVEKEYIERKNKTVPWCASCQTVLASAEIEYEDRKDPSIYVRFPLVISKDKNVFPEATKPASVVIWTTTPWTLPLNRAVLVHPSAEYAVIDTGTEHLLVGKQLVETVCGILEIEPNVVTTIKGSVLAESARAQHPFIKDFTVPIIIDHEVGLDEGTAFVHCAPGCGPIDYEIGIRNGLEIFSPISADGRYTEGIIPVELKDMPVKDGQIWVLKKLAELGSLLAKKNIKHSYPHCWRCHEGLIFRATKQWFCDLAKNNLRERVLKAINNLKMLPENSNNRLRATVEGRLEWCLSRQRIWGVPIPAILCESCDYVYTSQELVNFVARHVETAGIEYWDQVDVAALVPEGMKCPECSGCSWRKEKDTLDVWFDSGISHYAVLAKNPELAFPADVYVEGKDQHRGWFQSSLLTSMVLEEAACTKAILTHGFTVDEKGRKMSKSLGNVAAPQQLIDRLGVDGLRLWTSTVDYVGEVTLSETLLRNVQEVFRKIRNTARFLLSNLYDFDIGKNAVPLERMRMVDRYALQQLFETNARVIDAYDSYDFTAVFNALANYCSSDLSSFYLDIVKDRLYVEKADGADRRSAQTACWYILDALTKLMAPILSITAEQISDHYQKNKKDSIHMQTYARLTNVAEFIAQTKTGASADVYEALINPVPQALKGLRTTEYIMNFNAQWDLLKDIRSALLKAIEEKREQGMIKHSLEVRLTVYFALNNEQKSLFDSFAKDLATTGQQLQNFFKEFLIVSQFEIVATTDGLSETTMPGVWALVETAHGEKCPRCWQWEESSRADKLCRRCTQIVG